MSEGTPPATQTEPDGTPPFVRKRLMPITERIDAVTAFVVRLGELLLLSAAFGVAAKRSESILIGAFAAILLFAVATFMGSGFGSAARWLSDSLGVRQRLGFKVFLWLAMGLAVVVTVFAALALGEAFEALLAAA